MVLIRKIYAEIIELGFVRNQNGFSEIFLGKSKRYYSFLIATEREPPLHVLISLALRLERLAGQLDAHQGWKAEQLKVMAEEIRREVDRRSLLIIPRRHHSALPTSIYAHLLCQ